MPYDDDQYGANNVASQVTPILTTNDANDEMGDLRLFVRAKIIAANAYCNTVIFDEATTTINIYADDGSIGQIIMTTATLGQLVDGTVTETVISSTSSLTFQQGAKTATGDCVINIQYQELFPD